jgi:transposase-like protein
VEYLYRAIDREGTLVDVMLSEHRDLATAKAVTGVMPDRVTTDGHDAYLGRSERSSANVSSIARIPI